MTSRQDAAAAGACDVHPGSPAMHQITRGGVTESLCCACNYAKHGGAARAHPECMRAEAAARGAVWVAPAEAVPGRRYRVTWAVDGAAGGFESELLGRAGALVFANGASVGGWGVGLEEAPAPAAADPRAGTVISIRTGGA